MTVYLYREITANHAADLPISLGSGGPLTVWLNGEKVLAENVNRAPAPDQAKPVLKLKAGKNALLIKACYVDHGREFFFNATPPAQAAVPQVFEDVSDTVGLGTGGVAAGLKGDQLLVADVNGDGRPDFLFSAGNGVLVLNTPNGFVESKDSGLSFKAGKVTPLFGDFAGGKGPDLFVPQNGGVEALPQRRHRPLHRRDRQGRRRWRRSSATRPAPRGSTSGSKGKPGLLIGCLKGPNRYSATPATAPSPTPATKSASTSASSTPAP